MSYQIRHNEMGIYQGSFIGLGFWHPMSDEPEQGLCEFPILKEVEEYVAFLCSDECTAPLNHEDLTIEPFDKKMNDEMVAAYLNTLKEVSHE